jgi:hypothetical protein
MSFFSWLFPAQKPAKALPESSGLSRMEATRPVARNPGKDASGNNAQPANRKGERMARRELLYTVVRDAMMRAGVLSASYKFKVLSLDGRGRQFLVMVDLARNSGAETSRLAEIEALIAQGAKARYDIIVTAVYWRMNEHVAVGDPTVKAREAAADSQPMPLDSQPAVLEPQPVPVHSQPAPLPAVAATRSRFEPIQADEVAAFKQALAAGVAKPAAAAAAAVGVAAHGATAKAFDGSSKHGPQSYTLLTGFEDTELPDPELRVPTLSGTQYGELN